jgi:NAD-dependent dihydropyrimidine dehydrogenase PreA subunit
MTYVITEPCIGTKEGSCVEVCPVDCIQTDDAAEQYFINPEECIDCGACVSTCPVQAIFADDEVPPGQEPFTAVNAQFFAA